MRRRTLHATIAALAVLPAAPAAAAELRMERSCYAENQDVVVRGTGFAPGARVTVSQDGSPKGSVLADGAGAFAGTFPVARLPRGMRQLGHRVEATDGRSAATAGYRVSRLFADFSPGSGNPSTLRVRFSLFGFALERPARMLYVHYVRPDGRLHRTVRLGAARGDCGSLGRTRERRLFGFRAQRGRWILQFDARPRYRRGTQRSSFLWVRKPVRVFARPRG